LIEILLKTLSMYQSQFGALPSIGSSIFAEHTVKRLNNKQRSLKNIPRTSKRAASRNLRLQNVLLQRFQQAAQAVLDVYLKRTCSRVY